MTVAGSKAQSAARAARGSRTARLRAASRVLSLALAAAVWMAPQGRAQSGFSTGTVRGTVTDPGGALVANATVTVRNTATGTERTVATTGDGTYQVPTLIPGTYMVEVVRPGFEKEVAAEVTVSVGQTVVIDAHLRVGGSAETITVQGNSTPLIDTSQVQQANTIDRQQQVNLPNISRNFAQQVFTLPGVSSSANPSVQDPSIGTGYQASGFSIGGGNGRSNLFTIDGGQNDAGSGAPRVAHVPQDSVEEFQVNRNSFGAEFGFTVGSAINVVTRSGTNKFHGKAFEYFHDNRTDAANYFNSFGPTAGFRPYEQSEIFGGSVGGPILHNKLFFFSSYERQKLDSAVTTNLVSTAAAQGLQGQVNNFTGSSCPAPVTQACYLAQLATSADPRLAGLANFFRTSAILSPINDPIYSALISPNSGTFDGNANGGAVQAPPNADGRYNNWVSRLDYQPNQTNSISLRFSLTRESNNVIGAGGVPRFTSVQQQVRDYTITTNWTHILSPNIVNTVRVQVVPFDSVNNTAPRGGAEFDLGSLGVQGTPFDFPYNQSQNQYQFDDDLAITKGKHNIKLGESWRPVQYSIFQAFLFGGEYEYFDGAVGLSALFGTTPFGNLQQQLGAFNVANGYPAAGPGSTNLSGSQLYEIGLPLAVLQGSGNGQYNAASNPVGFYAQDSWKVSNKLTANYGGRIDIDPTPNGYPFSIFGSPRVGAAFDPRGDGKTVVRAGFGLFTAPVLFIVPFTSTVLDGSAQHIYASAVTANNPAQIPTLSAIGTAERSLATVANPNPGLSLQQLSTLGVNVAPTGPNETNAAFFTVAPNFKSQYSIQASAGVAQELARSLSLELGYLYYQGIHIQQIQEGNFAQNPNAPVDPFIGPQYAPRPGSTNGTPNTQIVQNDQTTSDGESTYNALTASLTKRYGHGLQLQANYTYSKAIDNTSDFSSQSTPFRPFTLQRDRAISAFNVPQNFVFNAVYTSPAHHRGDSFAKTLGDDFVVAPIVTVQSGVPFTLLVPGIGSNGTGGAHTNEARPYNEARNLGIGPSFSSWDMRISRAFPLRREGVNLNAIVQSTNILNRTNFSSVQNIFPNTAVAGANGLTASALVPTPEGTVDLLNGPYRYRGFRPNGAAQLTDPLAFRTAGLPRQISFGLELNF